MPKISCVLSTYNRPEMLERAIQSVVDQSFEDWELLVVSDGVDKTNRKTTESFKDKRIRYIEVEHFGNHSRPKNEGTRQAKGEYLCYLDDDNCYRIDHMAILLKAIENSDVDIVYGERWMIDDVGLGKDGEKMESTIGTTNDWDSAVLMQSNYIDTSDTLMKREVVMNLGGWDERYKKFLDWNLWCRADKYGYTFKRVPAVITDYHLVKGCMSMDKLDSKDMFVPAWSPTDCEIELPYLKEVIEPRVAVFSLTYDRLSETTVSFGTLRTTAAYPFTHIVVDNGSTDGTVEWLIKEYAPKEDTQLIINSENKGISIASNQAVDWAMEQKYDIIVKVDNDAIFKTKGWLNKMVRIWKANRKLAMSCYVSGLKDNPGGAPRVVYGKICGELMGMARHLGGITHFVDAKAYQDFRWPVDETLHGNQDVEFSTYLQSHGYQMGYLENFFVNHGLGGTQGQLENHETYFERRKWEKCHVYGDKNDPILQ